LDSDYSKSQFRLKFRRKVAFGPVCRWQHYTHAGSAPAGKIETQGLKRCESWRTRSASQRCAGSCRRKRGTGDERTRRCGVRPNRHQITDGPTGNRTERKLTQLECRLEERLHFVLARTWDLLPETIYRRLLKRNRMAYERRPTWAYDRALALYSLFRNLNGEQGN